MKTVIRVKNLHKKYPLYAKPSDRVREIIFPWKKYHKEHYALQDINFEIQKGEHLGIIGKNGSGKSTLLKIICGVLTPTQGTVESDGTVAALLELGAGFNREMTGRENIEFMSSLLGYSEIEKSVALKRIIDFANIGEYIDQPVKTYSSGMFVRLAFSQSLISNPDILVVDEALSVGDIFFQQKCIRRMNDYRETGTIIFVSHDIATMANICTKVLWIEDGRIREYGDAKSVCDKYLGDLYRPKVELGIFEDSKISTASNSEAEAVSEIYDFIKPGKFDHFDSTGSGAGRILDASLLIGGVAASRFCGGESTSLKIQFASKKFLKSAVIGFILKNRLGQNIYGTNTEDEGLALTVESNIVNEVVFKFEMPKLQSGDYTILIAFSEGTCANFYQLHLVYDALSLTMSRGVDRGVVFYTQMTSVEHRKLI
jgi:lipopolysaccharide transport system ATP-binding protein